MPEMSNPHRPAVVMVKVVPDVSRVTLFPHIKERVLPKSVVYTDELPTYNTVGKMGYHHSRIHHQQKVYVSGDVHTNTIDGFWGTLKNGISGVYHGVSTKHLQAYLDEYAFRYNNRTNPGGIFNAVLARIQKAKEQQAASE